MSGLILHASNLSAIATGALISAVWEGALLAALVFIVLRTLPGLSAAARAVVWLNVFVLLALLHILPVFTSGTPGGHVAAVHALRLDPLWSLAIAGLWLILSLVRLGQLIQGAAHLHQMARRALPVDLAREFAPLLMHSGRAVQLCASDEVARPSVLGFFRPRILVPPPLLSELSGAELKQVILHEMEHLHRADDWTNLLQKLALVLFPLNPALAWVERRLCAERELACDDRVLHSGSGRKAYALCLTHLAEFALVRRGFSLILGAWERRPELVRRVHRILSEPGRSMGRGTALAAMGFLTTGALVCTLVLAHAPQLVRFAPIAELSKPVQASLNSLDVRELDRELGGTPQFVKAVAPNPNQSKPAHRAVVRRQVRRTTPPSRLADLRMPERPASQPAGTLLVMTRWNDAVLSSQMVMAVHAVQQVDAPVTMRPAYAIVRVPDGWLVIRI